MDENHETNYCIESDKIVWVDLPRKRNQATIWGHVKVPQDDEGRPNKKAGLVKCNLCFQRIRITKGKSSTSNILSHFRIKHKDCNFGFNNKHNQG